MANGISSASSVTGVSACGSAVHAGSTIDTWFSRWDEHGAICRERTFGGGVEYRAGRHRAVANVKFMGASRIAVRGNEQCATLAYRHLEQPGLSWIEQRRQRHSKLQFLDRNIERISGGRAIVALSGSLIHLVEDIGAHDEPVAAWRRRRQCGIESKGVRGISRKHAGERRAPDQPVANVPRTLDRIIASLTSLGRIWGRD